MGIGVRYKPYREPIRKVGFWKDTRALIDFSGFPDPRDRVDSSWAKEEREAVAAYLDRGKTYESWMGFSYCRFECGVHLWGNKDLTDGSFVWPEDLSHYVRVHSVRLPKEFLQHVRSKLAQ